MPGKNYLVPIFGGFMWCYELVHIRDICAGDTVLHDGELRTVSRGNIGGDAFIGRTLFGDSYKLGHKAVIKARHMAAILRGN